MTSSGKSREDFVVCVDNSDYLASLELHKIYRRVPDPDAESDGDIRVVDESGEDYIYSRDRFAPIRVPRGCPGVPCPLPVTGKAVAGLRLQLAPGKPSPGKLTGIIPAAAATIYMRG